MSFHEIPQLLQSFFRKCNRDNLKLLGDFNCHKHYHNHKNVFIFNEYHSFPQKRTKITRKGRFQLDRNSLVSFFTDQHHFLRLLAVTVDKNSDIDEFLTKNIEFVNLFHHVVFVNNEGRDIGSYVIALDWVRNRYPELEAAFVANSSLSFDNSKLDKCMTFFETDHLNKYTIGGLGYGYGPRYVVRKFLHLQSYCLFGSLEAIDKYLSFARIDTNKFFLIRCGEVRMSRKWLALNLTRILFLTPNLSLFIVKHSSSQFKTFDSRFDL